MRAELKFGAASAALLVLGLAPASAQQADPPGDASTQARLTDRVESELSPAGDSDWYRLRVEQGQRYAIALDGVAAESGDIIDPTLSIWDSEGAQLAYNDDAGGSLNSALQYTPQQSGEVFVEARGFSEGATGRYTLTVAASNAPPDDVGSDASTRARVTPGRDANGAIESEGDVDWFRLTARSSQRYTIAVTGGDESGQLPDPVVRIIDLDGVELAGADDSEGSLNPNLEWTPQGNGDVFVEVSGYGGTNVGAYNLTVQSTRAPSDGTSGDARTRGRIALGGAVNASLDFSGDQDWYRVRLEEGQSYRFTLAGDGEAGLVDPLIKIHNADGEELASDDDGGDGLNSYLEFTAPATGNYFVEARSFAEGQTGAYVLTAREGEIPADASTDVSLSAEGDFREGALSPAGDRDWFRIDLAEGGGVRVAMNSHETPDALGDPLLVIYGADGAELARDDDGGDGLNAWLEFSAPTAGSYYVGAQAFTDDAVGRYTITVTPGEIGASAEGAEMLTANGEGRTSTITSADVDWFAIELVEGRPYRFYLEGTGQEGGLGDPLLTLFDVNGTQVAADDDGGVGVNSYLTFASTTGGVYYAAVSGYEGSTGQYYLRATDTDVPGNISTDEFLDQGGDERTSKIDMPGDSDTFRVELEAGVRYTIEVNGSGDAPLADPFLTVLNMENEEVTSDDDSGAGRDARVRFTPEEGGPYFLKATGLGGSTGWYTISIARQ